MKAFFLTATLVTAFLQTNAHALSESKASQLSAHYESCFILYDVNKQQVVSETNPDNRCNHRISPNSTFKIPLSLMAFNEKLIDQNTVFIPTIIYPDFPNWNQCQSPHTWLVYSVVWVSQKLTQQLKMKRIQTYLADFHYGNQDFSGDLDKNNGLSNAWLDSSLKISAFEQLNFLKAMLSHTLSLSKDAVYYTKVNLYQEHLDKGATIYGKTGSGATYQQDAQGKLSKIVQGWYVGFIEQDKQQYIFVSNITDSQSRTPNDKHYGSELVKPITLTLLNAYFNKA
ncbi:MAG: penicillin-binding transpeptidase domain-containing protein [Tatlockia sp.]|jgi:beta-lactamase class D/beta-lactamase class D OXA-1